MYPGILLTHPDIAAAMLEYRVAHIPGAEYKAQTYKPPFSGAMFSWESAVSGTELAGAPWGSFPAPQSPRPRPPPTNQNPARRAKNPKSYSKPYTSYQQACTRTTSPATLPSPSPNTGA